MYIQSELTQQNISQLKTTLEKYLFFSDISIYDEIFLLKSLQRRMKFTNCFVIDEYFKLIEQNYEEAISFFDSLHICYSEFFRNPLTFAVLEHILLPELIQKMKNTNRKEIRIWSTACAAGQEAYSIAMLLEELKNANNKEIKYRIFATDISESQLQEAIKGEYPASALNNLNMKRAEQWFIKQGEIYSIKPELRKRINFSAFDLLNKQTNSPPVSIFGDFDLIICANLLFYYNYEFQKIILKKATNCLANGGYLVTGESERNILMNCNYHEAYPHSAIFQIN
ncbi:MAG: hypothetical protein HGB12_04355 [Bacteroidetes bacterium]|nr:hypothetical protein [Bacteroidota bacterium]